MSEVRFTWNANTEVDLAGYKLYAGTATTNYNAPGSPKDMGNVTSGGFDIDQTATWFFTLTAYNTSGLESPPSAEINRGIALGIVFGKGN